MREGEGVREEGEGPGLGREQGEGRRGSEGGGRRVKGESGERGKGVSEGGGRGVREGGGRGVREGSTQDRSSILDLTSILPHQQPTSRLPRPLMPLQSSNPPPGTDDVMPTHLVSDEQLGSKGSR